MADHLLQSYLAEGEEWMAKSQLAVKRIYSNLLWKHKYRDASLFMEKAANCFRISKAFEMAGACYKRAAGFERRLGNPKSAATFYHEAAICYEKDDPHAAVRCYSRSINVYCQIRLFQAAANLELEIARLMEVERNYGESGRRWLRASNFLKACGAHNHSQVNLCITKAADMTGKCGDYIDASKLYERAAVGSLGDNLLKFNAPVLYYKAILCQLAMGRIGKARRKVKKYTRLHGGGDGTIFASSRECLFVKNLIQSFSNADIDAFADHVYAFDNAAKLDAWSIRTLAELKVRIEDRARRKQERLELKARERGGMPEGAATVAEGSDVSLMMDEEYSEEYGTVESVASTVGEGQQGHDGNTPVLLESKLGETVVLAVTSEDSSGDEKTESSSGGSSSSTSSDEPSASGSMSDSSTDDGGDDDDDE